MRAMGGLELLRKQRKSGEERIKGTPFKIKNEKYIYRFPLNRPDQSSFCNYHGYYSLIFLFLVDSLKTHI